MPPIDPRIVKAKRFPAHAAIAVCCMTELKRLLTEDAPFHVVRKIPDLELSVMHSACSSRLGAPLAIFSDMIHYLIEVSLLIFNNKTYSTYLNGKIHRLDSLVSVATVLIKQI